MKIIVTIITQIQLQVRFYSRFVLSYKPKIRILSRCFGNNKCCFCLQRISLYFKAMPNSIDFYKEIFLHVIPVRIIVPWFYSGHTNNTVFLICRKFTNGNLDEFKRLPFLESNSCMLGSIINYPHCICKAVYYIIQIHQL